MNYLLLFSFLIGAVSAYGDLLEVTEAEYHANSSYSGQPSYIVNAVDSVPLTLMDWGKLINSEYATGHLSALYGNLTADTNYRIQNSNHINDAQYSGSTNLLSSTNGGGWVIRHGSANTNVDLSSHHDGAQTWYLRSYSPEAQAIVDNTAPVPEPSTVMIFGIVFMTLLFPKRSLRTRPVR